MKKRKLNKLKSHKNVRRQMYVLNTNAEAIFQAVTDNTRIRVMRLLAITDEEACLCEFVDSLLEPEYKLSRHIGILKNSGLLTSRKDGRWVYHRLVSGTPHLEALYETIKALPDTHGLFKMDFANFKKRLRLREGGRCQVGIQCSQFIQEQQEKGG